MRAGVAGWAGVEGCTEKDILDAIAENVGSMAKKVCSALARRKETEAKGIRIHSDSNIREGDTGVGHQVQNFEIKFVVILRCVSL